MKILLINDTTDWCHWGCTGTSLLLKEKITELGFTIDSYPARLSYQGSWNNRPSTFESFNSPKTFKIFSESNVELIKKIKESNIIIINGEGTLHGIKDPPLNLLYIAYISKNFINKHVEIINHSVFPEDGSSIYQYVYRNLDFIAVREPLSQTILQHLKIPSTLSFDCLPLYIKKYYKTKTLPKTKNIVISGSAAWDESRISEFMEYVRWISHQEFQINILTGAKSYHRTDSDLVTFLDDEKFVNAFKKNPDINWQLINAKSIEKWLNTIADATLLVSGRFHHTIAAACLGTPYITLNSNTPKIEGLMQSLDQPEPVQYMDDKLFEKLKMRTELSFQYSNMQKSNDTLNKLCNLAYNNFNGLNILLRSEGQISI